MASRLYLLSIRWAIVPIDVPRMDQTLTAVAPDWLRYSSYSYYIFTPATQGAITAALQKAFPKEQFTIVAVQPEAAQGISEPWIWTWLNDRMQRQFAGRD